MGFGGTGSYILTAIKQISVVKHGEKPDELQFLEFDTLESEASDEEDNIFSPGKYLEGDEENNEDFLLDEYQEYYHLSDQKPDFDRHIEKHVSHPVDEGYEHFENWLHAKWMSENLAQNRRNIATGAGQHRQIGRYAMFRNAEDIRRLIQEKLSKAATGGALVPVWLVGSAAGGTGAGTMIDAAFITRKAARDADVKIEVAGVVVLPSVYDDVAGIDEARVHSFFRELERFQTATNDKFEHEGRQIASFVEYPNFRSDVSNQLFDNLIYVGEKCASDAERREFFTSVGNALEPYLDGQAGAELLEATANDTSAFSSFGAARLYVPRQTYAERFAQEQMRDYLDAVVPRADGPQTDGGGVEAGAPGQRQTDAVGRVKALLNFGNLLKKEGWGDDRYERFVNNLSPRQVVTGWCQFNNIASREDQRIARNAYANPLYSLTEPDPDRVDEAEIRLKTYNELSNSGGSETQENSRDRFYKKLKDFKDRYTNEEEGGPEAFEKGRKRIREVVTEHLIDQIDRDIIGALSGPVTGDDASGTSLTRVYQELKHILAADGPLATVKGVLKEMIDVAKVEEKSAEDAYSAERDLLDREGPSGMLGGWSTWVEAPQQDARDAATDYFDWYQKRRLLQEMRKVVQEVEERYEAWRAQVKEVVHALVLGENPVQDDIEDKITTTLDGRLKRMSEQGTAMISLKEGDRTMQGYQDVLRSEAVLSDGITLSEETLRASAWEASADDGDPVLALTVDGGTAAGSGDASGAFRKDLPRALRERFREKIDARLKEKDVFDYLTHVIQNTDFDSSDIAARLETKSEPLLKGDGAIDFLFVHAAIGNPQKAELEEEIRENLGQGANHLEHGDEDALTLVQAKKPQDGHVTPELDDYKKSYTDLIDVGEEDGESFVRAPVNHPFRPELEAWFIERYFQEENPKGAANYYLPPRIVRLLEYPRMMQDFVYGLASGAIEKTQNRDGLDFWVWHNTERDLECGLTDPKVEDHDLIQAATTFVLRQKPLNYTIDIDAETARQSAHKAAEDDEEIAQKDGPEVGDVPPLAKKVEAFTEEKTVRTFLDNHADTASQEEREALARVFRFYGRWGTSHGLHNRKLENVIGQRGF